MKQQILRPKEIFPKLTSRQAAALFMKFEMSFTEFDENMKYQYNDDTQILFSKVGFKAAWNQLGKSSMTSLLENIDRLRNDKALLLVAHKSLGKTMNKWIRRKEAKGVQLEFVWDDIIFSPAGRFFDEQEEKDIKKLKDLAKKQS